MSLKNDIVKQYDRNKNWSEKDRDVAKQSELARALVNKCKIKLLQKVTSLCSIESVLDLCCGRGPDIPKYLSFNMERYIGTDISIGALKEARARFDQIKAKKAVSFKYFTLVQADLTAVNLKLKAQVDLAIIHLAIHYLVDHTEHLFKTLRNCLLKNGLIIVSFLDKQVITSKDLKLPDYVTIKHIDENYYEYSFDGFLHKIQERYVSKMDLLVLFQSNGFTLVEQGPFEILISEESVANKIMTETAAAMDKSLTGLMSFFIFKYS